MGASKFVRPVPEETVRQRFRGCLLGGAVGDALGAPVEFLRRNEILRRFGPDGITQMAPAYGVLGAITDDTQMMLFTAEGVLCSYVRHSLRGICHPPSVIAYAYLRWLHTQGLPHPLHEHCLTGWLIGRSQLHARRAPGITCISALKAMESAGEFARNDSKGCGGVMRVAPVGMMLQALSTHSPEARDANFAQSFDLACEAAALTHGHPTGQLTAGAFSAIVFQLLEGRSLTESVDVVLGMLERRERHEETTNAIRRALHLAAHHPNDPDALRSLGEGWVAEEALAIGLYCALGARDYESGVILAVNHDGDSDSTGLIAGHLLGAMHGLGAIPERWLQVLELREVIEEVADDLATVGRWRLGGRGDPAALAEEEYYTKRYPAG